MKKASKSRGKKGEEDLKELVRGHMRTILKSWGLWESYRRGSIPVTLRRQAEQKVWDLRFNPPSVALSAARHRAQQARQALDLRQHRPA